MAESTPGPRKLRLAIPRDFLDASGRIGVPDIGLGQLGARADVVEYRLIDTDTATVMPEQIAEADALMLLAGYVKRESLAGATQNLTAIGRFGVGYDKVDVAALTEHDVAMFIASDASPHSLASAALTFMLALAKGLVPMHQFVTSGQWKTLINYPLIGHDIEGRTLGIVGVGRSGYELARLARPFNMRVLGYARDLAGKAEKLRELGIEPASLDEVLRESDFVSLHCPLTPETRGLIDAQALARMKPSAYMINISRGALVDQAALAAALAAGRLAGAGLDVFAHEPLALDDPLLKLDHVLLTPHILASSHDVWAAYGRVIAAGLIAVAEGRVPANVVNPEVLERPGFQRKLARFRR